MGQDEVDHINDVIFEMRRNEICDVLDNLDHDFEFMIRLLDNYLARIDGVYQGFDPGFPAPDSHNARAWDYLSMIQDCRMSVVDCRSTWKIGDGRG
jgi:hypothetical protein